MNSRRRGQVWEEKSNAGNPHLYIVLGEKGGWYELLNVDKGRLDTVSAWALDQGSSRWTRVA